MVKERKNYNDEDNGCGSEVKSIKDVADTVSALWVLKEGNDFAEKNAVTYETVIPVASATDYTDLIQVHLESGSPQTPNYYVNVLGMGDLGYYLVSEVNAKGKHIGSYLVGAGAMSRVREIKDTKLPVDCQFDNQVIRRKNFLIEKSVIGNHDKSINLGTTEDSIYNALLAVISATRTPVFPYEG